jgi:hypothetical protein
MHAQRAADVWDRAARARPTPRSAPAPAGSRARRSMRPLPVLTCLLPACAVHPGGGAAASLPPSLPPPPPQVPVRVAHLERQRRGGQRQRGGVLRPLHHRDAAARAAAAEPPQVRARARRLPAQAPLSRRPGAPRLPRRRFGSATRAAPGRCPWGLFIAHSSLPVTAPREPSSQASKKQKIARSPHHRTPTTNLPCRTLDPEEADFFYVPVYASCYGERWPGGWPVRALQWHGVVWWLASTACWHLAGRRSGRALLPSRLWAAGTWLLKHVPSRVL